MQTIHTSNPETPINTIHGAVWDLNTRFPGEISKPSRGLYLPATGLAPVVLPSPAIPKFREDEFYIPFAEWLKNDLDEATIAITLGGAGLQKKWGTPDVVGVYKPLALDRIKFPLEIISAEIKSIP